MTPIRESKELDWSGEHMHTQNNTTQKPSATAEKIAQHWSLTEYDNEATIFDQHGNRICDASALTGARCLISEINAIIGQRDELLEALKDIETRTGYSLARTNHANNDIQLEYVRQKAANAIAKVEERE